MGGLQSNHGQTGPYRLGKDRTLTVREFEEAEKI